MVIGDDMADWLGYGLEDVFSDTPEIRVVRKNKLNSGLLRYDAKGDLDWWHVARDTVAQEKADYVVMMLGIGDRQDIREKDLAKEADTRAKDQQAKDQAAKDPQAKDPQAKEEAEKKGGQKPAKTNDTDENATPSAQRAKKTGGSAEFRSEEWEKVYSRRIDDTIAALKSKGVPVIWVGLPPIRGARSSGDTAYLNELYRARAERAGIKYVDVWDGFVDEAGKYSNYGPDYEGQVRRLRSSDGVFFTKAGAIKLARYVEQELSRYMSNRVPVALPSGPFEATPSESRPTERPLMGPVIPMSGTPKDKEKDSDNLLGSSGSNPIQGDAIATKVLAKGEAVAAPPGRADNFAWPNGSQAKSCRGCARNSNCGPAQARGACDGPAKGCAQRFGLGAGRHQATGAEEGQRWKTHAAEAGEKLDTAGSYGSEAAAGRRAAATNVDRTFRRSFRLGALTCSLAALSPEVLTIATATLSTTVLVLPLC